MASIKIDCDESGLTVERFETREDWDRFAAQYRPDRGYYNPQPRSMNPTKFPCVMLSDKGCIFYNGNRNDEYWNMFLPDGSYEIIED